MLSPRIASRDHAAAAFRVQRVTAVIHVQCVVSCS
jgi:hypothetical protein